MTVERRLRVWRLWLRSLLFRTRVDDELSREIRFHLERETADLVAQGMAPEDAMHAACQRFGPVTPVVESVRDERRMGMLDHALQDLRYGWRSLLRTPVLMIAIVGTLAIGIGATSSLFSLLDQLIFRKLPVPHPEQLFSMVSERAGSIGESVPYPVYASVASDPSSGKPAGYAFRIVPLAASGDSAVVQLTSSGWFETVGIRPIVGRSLDESSGAQAAIISDRFWRRMFARSPSAIGTTISLAGSSFVVIGVAPAGFTGLSLDYPVDIWIPIVAQPILDGTSLLDGDAARATNWVRVVWRVPVATPLATVGARANVMLARTVAAGRAIVDSSARLRLAPASRPAARNGDQIARLLFLATALASLVLLIACANIANLQLARSVTRRREFGIRLAMGAGRARLVRQLMTENLMLAACSGVAGIGVAALIGRLVSLNGGALSNPGLAQMLSNGTDARALGFASVLTLLVAVVFGLAPALRSTRFDLVESLHATALGDRGSNEAGAKSQLLVAQTAMAILLLVSAGTVARTLELAKSLDLGFDPADVQQVSVDWRGMSDDAIRFAAENMAGTLRSTPGVQSVSISNPVAYTRSTSSTSAYHVAGDATLRPHDVGLMSVSAEFFTTMRIRITRGRGFSESDRTGSAAVVILNESAARAFFPGEDAVGRRFDLLGVKHEVEVVGVARDTRPHGVLDAPTPMTYIPFAQDPGVDPAQRAIEVRLTGNSGGARALSDAASRASAGRDVRIHALSDAIGESLAAERLSTWTTGALGIVGMLLAMLGVYGLHSFFVARRTAELAVRMALGASAARMRRMVWMQAMRPVLLGTAIGLALALASTQFLRGKILGLATVSIGVLFGATALMIGVASLACYLPAVRASRLSPAAALRVE